MGGALRVVAIVVGAAVICALVAAGAAYVIAARSLPDYDGSRVVEGLSAPVEILRDDSAVPHIFAQSTDDAFFGLGFAHAQDRLWTMHLSRRRAQGRLAEIFGEAALDHDILVRSLGLARHAQESLEELSPRSRRALDAYAAGVNARLTMIEQEELGRGAPEFHVFDTPVDPWAPVDSLAILKTMALQLSGAAAKDVWRARIQLALPPDLSRDLLEMPSLRDVPRREALIWPTPLSGASNAWAVAGDRASTGRPLMASDPHLPFSAPSLWYLAHLDAPNLTLIGATLPGVPAVLLGRNAHIAWGLTTAHIDDQDIFIERVDRANPDQYLTEAGPRRFRTRTETITVAGGEPVAITVRETRNGPVLPLKTYGLSQVTPEGHVPSLAWTSLRHPDRGLDAILGVNRARTIEAAAAASDQHVAPASNLILADADGIGMVTAGRVPLRRTGGSIRGRAPTPGWTGEGVWIGSLKNDAVPRLLRPQSGIVANANNALPAGAYPKHLSHDWDAGYRIQRLRRQLEQRQYHTQASFKAIQLDVVSEMARRVLALMGEPLWGDVNKGDGPRALVLERLAEWNGDMNENLAEPAIFAYWLTAFTEALVHDELGEHAGLIRGPRPRFVEAALGDDSIGERWCDNIETEARETCAEILSRSLDTALSRLARDQGTTMETWRWGRAHTAAHRHPPLGIAERRVFGVPLSLAPLVNLTQETGGGDHTINRGGSPHRGARPFENVHGAGFRAVYDFADLERSSFMIATGQSGHPLSRFYGNLMQRWAAGEYITIPSDRAEAGSLGLFTLTPAAP